MDATTELLETIRDWDAAMLGNDADAIGTFMAEDWTIIGADGRVTDKAAFLAPVRDGVLSHDVMETIAPEIRIYGDLAVVIAEGRSGGRYDGQAFLERERMSCVFIRRDGRWLCAHTHLSRIES